MCNLDDKIFENFKEIAKRLSLMYKELTGLMNINVCECKAIMVIDSNPNLTQTNLSQICGIDKPATSRLINKLQQDQLVQKFYKDDNKKNTYLTLTNQGELKANEIKKHICSLRKNYFNALNTDDKTNMLNILNKILINNKGGENA